MRAVCTRVGGAASICMLKDCAPAMMGKCLSLQHTACEMIYNRLSLAIVPECRRHSGTSPPRVSSFAAVPALGCKLPAQPGRLAIALCDCTSVRNASQRFLKILLNVRHQWPAVCLLYVGTALMKHDATSRRTGIAPCRRPAG